MGKLFFLWILIFSLLSCNKDSETYYEGYGLVNKPDKGQYTITLDDGNLLYPKESYLNPAKLKDSMRMFIRFNIQSETDTCTYIRIAYADTILTKSILPYNESNSELAGKDPVKITKAWFAHGFLNFEFMFAGQYPANSGPAHSVNLLQLSLENNKPIFEFRHNDFNNRREQLYMEVVSFPIQEILTNMKRPVTIIVKFSDSANTERNLEITYK